MISDTISADTASCKMKVWQLPKKWPNVVVSPSAEGRQGVYTWPNAEGYIRASMIAKVKVFSYAGNLQCTDSWEGRLSTVYKTPCQAWQQTICCRDVICIIMEANQAWTLFVCPWLWKHYEGEVIYNTTVLQGQVLLEKDNSDAGLRKAFCLNLVQL